MADGRARSERGASLVEFAFLAPVLFFVVFGIIEFGWAFAQHLDVRHGAREGARLTAVNYSLVADNCTPGGSSTCNDTHRTDLVDEICDRMDVSSGASVVLSRPGGHGVGDSAEIRVNAPLETLTGFLDPILGGITLKSDVETRLEQAAQWSESPLSGDPCP